MEKRKNDYGIPTAVITGATGGIGRELSLLLLRQGIRCYLVGQNFSALKSLLEKDAAINQDLYRLCTVDLADESEIQQFVQTVKKEAGIDYLVHGAAYFCHGSFREGNVENLDRSYRVNVRAPYLLTQHLLPDLISKKGRIIFLNSSAVLDSKRTKVMEYMTTKAALSVMADGIREGINEDGIQVMTLYLGKVATEMQQKACKYEGIPYHPEKMIQPKELAEVIYQLLTAPESTEITEMHIRPPVSYL